MAGFGRQVWLVDRLRGRPGRLHVWAWAMALLAAVGAREAQAVATGSIGFGCDFVDLGGTSGPLPLVASSLPNNNCWGDAMVEAGVVETYAANGASPGMQSSGEFWFPDIVFSASGGGPGTAQVAVKVHVEGQVNGFFGTYEVTLGHIETGTGDPGCNITGCGHLLFQGSGAFTIDYTTPTFQVDLNTPWTLKVGGRASSGAIQNSISATMGFQVGQPVFVLAPGVTANSTDGRILNNVFVGETACNDGIDNDGDQLVDGADPVCVNIGWRREHSECQDGINNDGQPGTDFDGGESIHGLGNGDPDGPDPQCAQGAWRNLEAKSRCGLLGIEVLLLAPLWWRRRAAARLHS